jgi:hypothetical protein
MHEKVCIALVYPNPSIRYWEINLRHPMVFAIRTVTILRSRLMRSESDDLWLSA